jgi:hypothetical protein
MDDAKEVLSALRLGWSVAEMRGRNRPGGPSGDIVGMPDHIDHPLPLRIERGKTELRIEVQSVVAELAQELRVDDSADGASLTAALGDTARLLSHLRAPKAADALQQALDLLQAPPDGQAGPEALSPPDRALQALRQGLAAQPSGSASWTFLLGERRCDELSRQTGRLAAYMGEYTAPAIAGSLEVWREVARTPDWLGDPHRADLALYSQIRRWFELIILEQDPTTLVGPAAVMKNYHTLGRALKLFWPELVATIVGVGFLVTLLFLFNVGAAGWAKTLSAILAVVGFSLAGLTGTLKNSAQALLKRLRQDAYTDLVAQAVLIAPPPPSKSAVQDAIRRRSLTPATPN